MNTRKLLCASITLKVLAVSISLVSISYADTYSYNGDGRLIGVVYEENELSYGYDLNGNLLALSTTPIDPPVNEFPEVEIVGGDQTIDDSNAIAGEIVGLTATATDSDGTIVTSEWLINDIVVATGLTPDIALQDGETVITFKATDDDGDSSVDMVTITVVAPPLEPGWPFPYSGVTPHESLGLDVNNISALNPLDGLIYSCLNIVSNGLQSSFGGIEKYDIAFEIVSLAESTIGVVRAKEFNATGALNENGELPDCSGELELTTSVYTDIIQAGADVYRVTFELFDGENLLLRGIGLELIGTVP